MNEPYFSDLCQNLFNTINMISSGVHNKQQNFWINGAQLFE